ncbi:hypothetical protein [Roseimarinus sediminis]|uniref:hypothetical protein n=1 Tax=Roseimarinus sediminis TaxID=1610899 RepID=UPI003D1A0D7D
MKTIFIQCLLLITLAAAGQKKADSRFIEHLLNQGAYREVTFLLDSSRTSYNDSLHHFKGQAHYHLKELVLSTEALLKVSRQSDFYLKSRFFAGSNCIFNNKYERATSIFSEIDAKEGSVRTLRNFELNGINVLNGHYALAAKNWQSIDSSLSVIYEPLSSLKNITLELEQHRAKSPVVAGLLSALVPGSGKIYAGKTGQGIAAFIATAGLGLISWENYNKLGATHIKTLAFGSAFAASYVSNIYGSVMTAKIVENEYQQVMHQQVLFHLHIPLRNYFR